MKNKKAILQRIAYSRFLKNVYKRELRHHARRKAHERYLILISRIEGAISYEEVIDKYLPPNISYLLNCEKSDFYFSDIGKIEVSDNNVLPKVFSIIDNPSESFQFIRSLIFCLLSQKYKNVKIDYSGCEHIDLGTQVLLDVILRDILNFFKVLRRFNMLFVQDLQGVHIHNNNIKKMLFSVGSPSIHTNKTVLFKDIIPYKLCVHSRGSNPNASRIIEQKDVDTTTLVDYVLDCLKRLKRKLTPEKIDNLCTVIGEILINAEEHSTTGYRFSIGYFHEFNAKDKHFGIFRLVIMNLGKTIYEKFKDPDCPNKDIVDQMTKLSETYTKKRFFQSKEFEEETLWTLYALQEGVTSVPITAYIKRGNGSIQFIENFFNMKGVDSAGDLSRMNILSGNASIFFDGQYQITEKYIAGEKFKYMTFNSSGNIEDKPDQKYVKFAENYFPGTLISAEILFDENDLIDETK
ncbi:hypothetical protein PV783_30175 [Chitinophaga sp. CC14]|uniref:hypothetical protein n=1 Tax=Chitinophaga sp. CC14 TaxID=3029199 RepID=UPI003B7B52EC